MLLDISSEDLLQRPDKITCVWYVHFYMERAVSKDFKDLQKQIILFNILNVTPTILLTHYCIIITCIIIHKEELLLSKIKCLSSHYLK